jgi:hypothetical protein
MKPMLQYAAVIATCKKQFFLSRFRLGVIEQRHAANKKEWIASSLTLLAMTRRALYESRA